jgi:hypothetical protein
VKQRPNQKPGAGDEAAGLRHSRSGSGDRGQEFSAGRVDRKYTLPIYVQYFFGRGGASWGPIMAASTLYTIPPVVFFLIVQRRMVGGLVAGSVKG